MLGFLIVLWMAVVLAEFALALRRSSRTVGLVLGWMAALSVSHWFGALAHWVPWSDLAPMELTERGFLISTIGLISLFAGARLIAPLLSSLLPLSRGVAVPAEILTKLPISYALAGAILLGVVSPIAGDLPTMTAVVSSGTYLVIVGISLAIWRYSLKGSRAGIAALLGWMFVFPAITLALTENVIRIVLLILITCCFAAVFYRPRWQLVLAAVVLTYGGLSLGIGYMQVRDELRIELREASSYWSKFERVGRVVGAFELLDLTNLSHLDLIDTRMNQNILVGAAEEYIASGAEEYARGETVVMAFQALIPRAIWPEKPVQAGGMGLAGRFTGMEFAESTSVGLGPILEWYVNFGMVGVVLGMTAFGALVRAMDFTARASLASGNWMRFALVYAAALPIIQSEGSFVGVSASVATVVILVWLINRLLPATLRTEAGKRVTA